MNSPPAPSSPPPPRTGVSGFCSLPARVRRAARGKTTVGFDVFDTLLVRRCEPEMVKDLVAKRFARLLAGLAPRAPIDLPALPDWRLLRHRRRVLEVDIGREHEAQGHDHEFHLRAMTRRWVQQCVGVDRPDLADALVRAEIDLERAATLPSPGVRRVLEAAAGDAASPRRLIWVSDSYLALGDIWDLLRHHGLADFFGAGYVSCTTLRTKRSGRLFDHVLEREQLAPRDLLFVGDNPYSDVDSPRSRGVDTLRAHDAPEAKRRARLALLGRFAQTNPFFAGTLARDIAGAARPAPPRCPHEALGQTLAWPFACYALHVLEESQRLGLGRVFFLAREGLTFLRIYRALVKRLGLRGVAPEGVYISASRKSTFLASMESLAWPDIDRVWAQYHGQSLAGLLRNLTLPRDEFEPHALRCGFTNLDEPIRDPRAHAPLARFLEDDRVRACFTRHRDAARRLLLDYLAQKGFYDHPRVGLVDIGWKGSIQSNIFHAARLGEGLGEGLGEAQGRPPFPACPTIEGFYFGLGWPLDDRDARSRRRGYMADTRAGDWTQDVVFKNGPVFEMFSTAPHGGCAGYRRLPTGRVKPIVRAEDAEAENFRGHFASVFRGVREGVRRFVECAPLVDVSAEDLRHDALDQLRRYILYPTGREARAFLRYSHVENFGVFKVSDYAFKGSWRKILWPPSPRGVALRWLHAMRTQFWPEAMVRRWRVPLGTFAYDVVETRRASRHVPR